MIRIVNTNGSVKNTRNQEWRRANCSGLADKVDPQTQCNTSQEDVDAVAAAMDDVPECSVQPNYDVPKIEPRSQQYGGHYGNNDHPHMNGRNLEEPQLLQTNDLGTPTENGYPSKEEVAQAMINQFVRQNGGLPMQQQEEKPKNNKLMLG